MKHTIFNKSWMYNSHNELMGVNLGFDFCSEHENGIYGIRKAFGISQSQEKPIFGIEARKTQVVPDIIFEERDGYYFIGYTQNIQYFIDSSIKSLSWEGRKKDEDDFVGYWFENGFLFATTNKKNYEILKKAFQDNDIAFYIGNRSFINSGGLHITIASKVDSETDQLMKELDEDAYNLNALSQQTSIEEKIKKSNKKIIALKPGWANEEKTEVWFWLNPFDQEKYKSGWFSILEIEDWLNNDKGPIIKTEENEKTI